METQKEEQILKNAIETFGIKNQLIKLMEESGELVAAIARFLSTGEGLDNVTEEMADTLILIHQKLFVWPKEIYSHYDKKIERLEARLKAHQENNDNPR